MFLLNFLKIHQSGHDYKKVYFDLMRSVYIIAITTLDLQKNYTRAYTSKRGKKISALNTNIRCTEIGEL